MRDAAARLGGPLGWSGRPRRPAPFFRTDADYRGRIELVTLAEPHGFVLPHRDTHRW